MTEKEALRAYAKAVNTLSSVPLEAILADDFHYESQFVFDELTSKEAFLDYITAKLRTIAETKSTVYAEMGTIAAYGSIQPCVVVAQNDKENLVGVVLAKVENGRLKRLDLCAVPSPYTAERSGEYPS